MPYGPMGYSLVTCVFWKKNLKKKLKKKKKFEFLPMTMNKPNVLIKKKIWIKKEVNVCEWGYLSQLKKRVLGGIAK